MTAQAGGRPPNSQRPAKPRCLRGIKRVSGEETGTGWSISQYWAMDAAFVAAMKAADATKQGCGDHVV